MVTKYALEGSESSRFLMQRVFCILGPRKVLTPAILAVVAVGPEVVPDLLNFLLSGCSSAGGIWRIDLLTPVPVVRKCYAIPEKGTDALYLTQCPQESPNA